MALGSSPGQVIALLEHDGCEDWDTLKCIEPEDLEASLGRLAWASRRAVFS